MFIKLLISEAIKVQKSLLTPQFPASSQDGRFPDERSGKEIHLTVQETQEMWVQSLDC